MRPKQQSKASQKPFFDFPFQAPYQVQLEARSFVHARLTDPEVQKRAAMMSQQINAAAGATSTAASLRAQPAQGITNNSNNNNNNYHYNQQNGAAASAVAASPRCTVLQLPTGVGKSVTALSSALHAQNVIARQALMEKYLNDVNKKIDADKLKALRKEMKLAHRILLREQHAARRTGTENNANNNSSSTAGSTSGDASSSVAVAAATNASSSALAAAAERKKQLEEQYSALANQCAQRQMAENLAAMQAASTQSAVQSDWLGDTNFVKDFCQLNHYTELHDGTSVLTAASHNQRVVGDVKAGGGGARTTRLDSVIPRVIFLTRTHAQIRELTNELRRFDESQQSNPSSRLLSSVVLGSRKEMCVHPGIKGGKGQIASDGVSYTGANAIGEFCDKVVSQQKCPHVKRALDLSAEVVAAGGVLPEDGFGKQYAHLFQTANMQIMDEAQQAGLNPARRVFDIEDIVKRGRAIQACPYYASRDLTATQRVIFAPYNYILDPLIRHETRLEYLINNSIIVVDEAHHLAGGLQDGFTFTYSREALRYACLEEFPVIVPEPDICWKLPGSHPLRPMAFSPNAAPTYEKSLRVAHPLIRFDDVMQFTYEILVVLHGAVTKVAHAAQAGASEPNFYPLTPGRTLIGQLHQELISLPWFNEERSFQPFVRIAGPQFLRKNVNSSTAVVMAPKTVVRTRFVDFKRQQEEQMNASFGSAASGDFSAGSLPVLPSQQQHAPGAAPLTAEEKEVRCDADILYSCASAWLMFGVTFNPFNLSTRTIAMIKSIFAGLVHLHRYPDAYTSYYESTSGDSHGSAPGASSSSSTTTPKAQTGGTQPGNSAASSATGMMISVEMPADFKGLAHPRDSAALVLRCLDASIGWRHLTRSTRHVILMSGTLQPPEVLSAQLGEQMTMCPAGATARSDVVVENVQPFAALSSEIEAHKAKWMEASVRKRAVKRELDIDAAANPDSSGKKKSKKLAAARKVNVSAAAAAASDGNNMLKATMNGEEQHESSDNDDDGDDDAANTETNVDDDDNEASQRDWQEMDENNKAPHLKKVLDAIFDRPDGAPSKGREREKEKGNKNDSDDEEVDCFFAQLNDANPQDGAADVMTKMRNASVPFPDDPRLQFKHLHPVSISRACNMFTGSHVADAGTQAKCAIITHLDNGALAQLDYKSRKDDKFTAALYSTLAKLILAVPFGALVFFQSYEAMKSAFFAVRKLILDDMKKTGRKLFMETSGNAPAFVPSAAAAAAKKLGGTRRGGGAAAAAEPDEDEDSGFNATMRQFKIAGLQRQGATFFAVMRGKVSEGVNLKQKLSRAVIVVGVPFGSLKSASVIAQREYAMKQNVSSWYVADAVCAVNQAVGRALRSTDDYGAIILLDSRYAGCAHYGSSTKLDHIKGQFQAALQEALESAGRLQVPENPLLSDTGRLLPAWLKPHIFPSSPDAKGVDMLVAEMKQFFRKKELEEVVDVADDDAKVSDSDELDESDFGGVPIVSKTYVKKNFFTEHAGSSDYKPAKNAGSVSSDQVAAAVARRGGGLLHPHLANAPPRVLPPVPTQTQHAPAKKKPALNDDDDEDALLFGASLDQVQRSKALHHNNNHSMQNNNAREASGGLAPPPPRESSGTTSFRAQNQLPAGWAAPNKNNNNNSNTNSNSSSHNGKPVCPFDSSAPGCYRKNPEHFRDMAHPKQDAQPVQK